MKTAELSRIWMIVSLCAMAPLSAAAHGDAVLCDVRGDLLEQCGEVHECITSPAVSPYIGYCKSEFEDFSFTICDRSVTPSPCARNEVCKIGTIDPQIGVCYEFVMIYPSTSTAVGGENETSEASGGLGGEGLGVTSDQRDVRDTEEGCTHTRSSSKLMLLGLLLLLSRSARREVG